MTDEPDGPDIKPNGDARPLEGWLAEKARQAELEIKPNESALMWLARTGGKLKLKLEDKK